jgi:glycosyltransferase involved in cell wall biosynthesis
MRDPPSPTARILYVEGNLDGTVGGSHRALFDLATGLDRRRFEPVVLFYQDNSFAGRLQDRGVEVIDFGAVRAGETAARLGSGPAGKLLDLARAIRRRKRLLAELRIDLVHLNNSPFHGGEEWIPAARVARIPIVASSRGNPRRPVSTLERTMAKRFDRVIPVSRWVRDGLLEKGLNPSRIRLVHDGVNPKSIRAAIGRSREEVRTLLGVPDDAFAIVMVGNLREWKGQHVLIEAMAQLSVTHPPARVLFVGSATEGDVPYVERLKEMVKRFGLEGVVTFLGHRNDVPDLLQMADVAVHASTDPEPFGLVVPEAMATGTVVVVSRFGGPGEVLCEGAGFLHDPSNPSELAGILQRLAEDPDLRSTVGAAGKARGEAFDVAKTVERMQAVYEELLPQGAADLAPPA